jgi:hypothetical protein
MPFMACRGRGQKCSAGGGEWGKGQAGAGTRRGDLGGREDTAGPECVPRLGGDGLRSRLAARLDRSFG